MSRTYGGRMRGQRTARRSGQRRGLGIAEPPTLVITDRQVFMLGADDGAGGSPARYWSEYDNAWTAITSPPVPFAGGGADTYTGDPSRFMVGGGYKTDGSGDNDHFWEYDSGIENVPTRPPDIYREFLPVCPVAGERRVMQHGTFLAAWFYVVGAAAPSDISYYGWLAGAGQYPGSGFFNGSWVDQGGFIGAPSLDLANIRGTLAFAPSGSGGPLAVTRTGVLQHFSGVSHSTIAGTNTDSIRLAYDFSHTNPFGSLYAIRVQGGVATTWHWNGTTWSSALAPLPRPRENFDLTSYGGFEDFPNDTTKLYVVGGDGTPWFDIYDAATDTWSEGPDLDVGVDNVSITYKVTVRTVPGI